MVAFFYTMLFVASTLLITLLTRVYSESSIQRRAELIDQGIITLNTTLKHPWSKRRMIVGGQARLALWCHIHGVNIPNTYNPRDTDYVTVARGFNTSSSKGIICNRGTRSSNVDDMLISSIYDYFNLIDLVTNQVILHGGAIYTTREAIDCFKHGLVKINLLQFEDNASTTHYEYMLMRACIQVGYDIYTECYHHRHGALKLSNEMLESIDLDSLKEHWYIDKYNEKLQQIKSGKH